MEDKTVQQAVVTILNQIYRKICSAFRMDFVQDVASIKRWMHCRMRS